MARVDDIARVIIPEAETLSDEARRQAVTAFLDRCGIGSRMAGRLLSGDLGVAPLHLLRLVALQRFLERENRLSAEDAAEVGKLVRALRKALDTEDSTADGGRLHVPLRFRKGSLRTNEEAAIDSAVEQIAMICRELGLDSLAGKAMLDIGCGVKFTQAFLNRALPIGRYHGVDVDRDMIAFLAEHVADPRFSYAAISVYNEMYNKAGAPLSRDLDLGTGDARFDVICLFSVFTHLAPHDYAEMLALARRHVAPTGRLIFTTFLDETIPGDFKDEDPVRPLLRALYKEAAVRRMVAEAGWRLERLNEPLKRTQHILVCAPA